MFSTLFFTLLKSIAIPIVVIMLLQSTMLGEKGAFLAVTIALSLYTVFSVLMKLLRIMGNTITLRGKRVIILALTIIIEIASVIGFWLTYTSRFA